MDQNMEQDNSQEIIDFSWDNWPGMTGPEYSTSGEQVKNIQKRPPLDDLKERKVKYTGTYPKVQQASSIYLLPNQAMAGPNLKSSQVQATTRGQMRYVIGGHENNPQPPQAPRSTEAAGYVLNTARGVENITPPSYEQDAQASPQPIAGPSRYDTSGLKQHPPTAFVKPKTTRPIALDLKHPLTQVMHQPRKGENTRVLVNMATGQEERVPWEQIQHLMPPRLRVIEAPQPIAEVPARFIYNMNDVLKQLIPLGQRMKAQVEEMIQLVQQFIELLDRAPRM